LRYRMLESIREYGVERLVQDGGVVDLRERHRVWYQQLAERAHAEWVSDRQGYWLQRLGREHPNLRAAVQFCLTEDAHVEEALRLVVALPPFYWLVRGLVGEGRSWLDGALARATEPTVTRARALLLASHLAFQQGDEAAGVRMLHDGQTLAGRLDAVTELAYAHMLAGLGALYAGELAGAAEAFDQAYGVLSRATEPDLDLRLRLLVLIATTAALTGDRAQASARVEELITNCEVRNERYHWSAAVWTAGLIDWLGGDHQSASGYFRDSLRAKRPGALADRSGVALCLETLAWTASSAGDHRRAAVLLGAAHRTWADLGMSVTAYRHLIGFHEACERELRAVLGDAGFADLFRHGQGLTPSAVLSYALGERPPGQRSAGTPPTSVLTSREREVAALVGEGLSNKEVAAKLVISQRTAESHVERIVTKLGLTNRAQVAAWAAAQSTLPGRHGGSTG